MTPFEQMEFAGTSAKRSQNDRALDLLCQRAPNWVSMLDLETASGSRRMNSRIADLRKRVVPLGWTIENKTEWKDGRCCSAYRLTKP